MPDLSKRPTAEKPREHIDEVYVAIKEAKLRRQFPGIDGDFREDRYCYMSEDWWKLDQRRREKDAKRYR